MESNVALCAGRLYRAQSRYGPKIRNNGRIYLSARQAAKETGFNRNIVAPCLRELEYYGFIVMTERGCLGVDGKGKAPHWRLTELGYMLDPPTRDFMRWDGEIFHEQKPPEYYKRQEQRLIRLRAIKKQKPVTTIEPPCHDHDDIPVARPSSQSDAEVARPSGHTVDLPCHDHQDISRVNHSVVPEYSDLDQPDLRGMPRDMSWYYKLTERRIASVGASVSTLGTLDAGLIVTNPGVA